MTEPYVIKTRTDQSSHRSFHMWILYSRELWSVSRSAHVKDTCAVCVNCEQIKIHTPRGSVHMYNAHVQFTCELW